MRDDNEVFSVIISTGNLEKENLVAEIYRSEEYIGSIYLNENNEVMADFTCDAINEVCRGKREIPLKDMLRAINEAMIKLDIPFSQIRYE